MDKKKFELVLKQAYDQVFSGKGEERHGHGTEFDNQPWKIITDNVGTGFVLGQAMKKLMELRTFVPKDNTPEAKEQAHKAWKREALGAIVYVVMAILYSEQKYEEEQL